jgi:hypothetical protein
MFRKTKISNQTMAQNSAPPSNAAPRLVISTSHARKVAFEIARPATSRCLAGIAAA